MSEITKTWYELSFSYSVGEDKSVYHYNDIILHENNIPEKEHAVEYLADKYNEVKIVDIGTLTLVEETRVYKPIEY